MESSQQNSKYVYNIPKETVFVESITTSKIGYKFYWSVHTENFNVACRIIAQEMWDQEFKTVVVFGGGKVNMMARLKRIKSVELVLQIDADEDLLSHHAHKTSPQIIDYLMLRENPLRVEVLHGNMYDPDERIRNIDVVLALDIIHRLNDDVLDKVIGNIFQFIKPKLAIFATPNAEFNVLLEGLLPNGLRSIFHNFEWTREEFCLWAVNICATYPNYKVSFLAADYIPKDGENFGSCTQMAIFARKDLLHEELLEEDQQNMMLKENDFKNYTEIFTVDYPYQSEILTLEEKILDKLRSLYHCFDESSVFFNPERNAYLVPLDNITEFIKLYFEEATKDDVVKVLENENRVIENDYLVLPNDVDTYEDEDEDVANNNEYDFNNYEENKENYVVEEEEDWN